MRGMFGLLSIVLAMAIGMYIYSRQAQSSSAIAGANNPKAAVNITGVKADLIAIASAERRHFATDGKYVSLDDLISGHDITVARQRPPYSYEVETTAGSFKVIATRTVDDGSGTPAQLSVDDNMEFQESQ